MERSSKLLLALCVVTAILSGVYLLSGEGTDAAIDITSTPIDESVDSGEAWSYTATVTGLSATYSTSFTLPEWITASADHKTFSGTAPVNQTNQAIVYTLVLKYINSATDWDSQTIRVFVLPEMAADLHLESRVHNSVASCIAWTYYPMPSVIGATVTVGEHPAWVTLDSGYLICQTPLVEVDTLYRIPVTIDYYDYSVTAEIRITVLAYDVDFIVEADEITDKTFDFSYIDSSEYPVTSVVWNFGDGSGASGAEVSHTYANSGMFDVTCTFQNDYDSDSQSLTLYVVEPLTFEQSFFTWAANCWYVLVLGIAGVLAVFWFTLPTIKTRRANRRR